jgi:alpha-glucosidase
LWLPQPEHWELSTVEVEEDNPNSVLNLYRSSLALRRAHPSLASEEIEFWPVDDDELVVFRRGADLVVVANTSDRWLPSPVAGSILVASGPVVAGDASVEVGPNTTVWMQV